MIVLFIGAFFLTGLATPESRTYAAIPKLDEIRVSLFIDSRGTVPAVTLSASELQIGINQADGVHTLMAAKDEPVRFSMDQYMLKWIAIGDYNRAKTVYGQLQAAGLNPYIFSTRKSGKPLYVVYTGHYASQNAAELVAAKGPGGLSPIVTGPYHVSAGKFASEAQADALCNSLNDAGITANVVAYVASGAPAFGVWVGEETSPDKLAAVQALARKAMPGLVLTPVDPAMPYLLKRIEVSQSASANSAVAHLFFQANSEKVWVTAKGSGIKVAERYGRTYRGAIEISQFNGKLAVINQLPFEQYLYSVVGSELSADWPLEALKAQAVAARTYALTLGMKYKIANISDTTFDQAYYGLSREFPDAIKAVEQTKGEVLVNADGLITPFYYSNGGGLSADPTEIWGTPIDYIQSVMSPDQDAQNGKLVWDRVVLANGETGYIRSDFVADTGEKNALGLSVVTATESNVNVRKAPYVDNVANPPIAQVMKGDKMIVFDQAIESNSFNWIRGPFTAEEMLSAINQYAEAPLKSPPKSLTVTARGPSGRVVKMQADGADIQVARPDTYRSAMQGVPSTRFAVEETGKLTVLGAGGKMRTLAGTGGKLAVISGSSAATPNGISRAIALSAPEYFIVNHAGNVRLATSDVQYRFIGLGNGHGLGMSQWGARALADLQYDYKYILQYYYKGVQIVKE